MIKINGEPFEADGMTIAEYLESSNYDRTRIAIELNEEFVPKTKYDETFLNDGDVLEVVSFVGGG